MTEPDAAFADLLDDLLARVLDGEQIDAAAAAARHPAAAHRVEEALALASDLAGRKVVARPSLRGYEIVRELGRGGMGTVYLARQTALDREVALKVLPHSFGLSAHSRQRFLEEARALARVQHEHIVGIHRIVDDGDLLAFEMEFVDGPSLQTVITALREHRRRDGAPAGIDVIADVVGVPAARLGARNPMQFFVRLFLGIARALGAVHAAGFVHRDVKPANLLLRKNGEPVVVDFGLVRLRSLEASQAGRFVGTPVYSSPEQLRGDVLVGPPADVYSLAVTMYECLTLATPFPGRTTTDLLQRIELGRFVPLRRLAPDAPRDLETIVAHAMEVDPARRYVDAGAFADDLQRLLELQPVLARPVRPLRRFGKFLRRNRRSLFAAATGALLVTLAMLPLMGRTEAAARARAEAAAHTRAARQHLLAIDAAALEWRPALRATGEREAPQRAALREYELALALADDAAVRRERDVVALASWLQQLTVSQVDAIDKALASETFTRLTADLGPTTVAAARVLATGTGRIDDAQWRDATAADREMTGLLALLGGDLGTCERAWSSLPGTDDHPLVDAGLGRLLLADGMPEAANVRLLRAQRHFPDSSPLALAIADTALRLGDLDAARRWLERTPADRGSEATRRRVELDLRAAGDAPAGDEIAAGYAALIAADASDPTPRHRLAQLALRRGDLAEAARRLDDLLREWPEASRCRLDRARVALQRRDLAGYAQQVLAVLARDFGREASPGAAADLLEILRLGGLESLHRAGIEATGGRRAGRAFLGGEMPIRGFAPPLLTMHFEPVATLLARLQRQTAALAHAYPLVEGPLRDALFTAPLALAQLPAAGVLSPRCRLALLGSTWLTPRMHAVALPLLRTMWWRLRLGGWNPIQPDIVPRPAALATFPVFGRVLQRVRDLDGDGIDDVLLGCCPAYPENGLGRVVLVDGRQHRTLAMLAGDSPGHLFAHSLAVIGDIDGDGVDDWLVGAPAGRADERRGRAELWSGQTRRRIASLEADEPCFGVSVCRLGDCDGDGRLDFAVASSPLLRNSAAQGLVRIYSGRTLQVLHTLVNDVSGVWFGACIADAGDGDGDGVHDLLVGGNFGGAPGLVRLYSGRTGAVLQTWSEPAANAGFGTLVRGCGDLDGDRRDDVIVTAVRGDEHSGLDQVFFFSGATGERIAVLTGDRPGIGFGTAVEPFANGGPATLFAVGIPYDRAPVAGAVRIVGLDGAERTTLLGPSPIGMFGHAIARTDDKDGDGLPELLVAEPDDRGTDRVLEFRSTDFLLVGHPR